MPMAVLGQKLSSDSTTNYVRYMPLADMRPNWLLVRFPAQNEFFLILDWHRIANRITLEYDGAILTNDACQQL